MKRSHWIVIGGIAVLAGGYFVGKKAYLQSKAGPWLATFKSAAKSEGVPETLLLAVADIESGFNPNAVNSRTGASGMMQLIPRFYAGVDPFNPTQAIPAAAKSLASYHREFGTWKLALAAYNWGPGNLKDKGFAQAPTETQNYVAKAAALAPGALLA